MAGSTFVSRAVDTAAAPPPLTSATSITRDAEVGLTSTGMLTTISSPGFSSGRVPLHLTNWPALEQLRGTLCFSSPNSPDGGADDRRLIPAGKVSVTVNSPDVAAPPTLVTCTW